MLVRQLPLVNLVRMTTKKPIANLVYYNLRKNIKDYLLKSNSREFAECGQEPVVSSPNTYKRITKRN